MTNHAKKATLAYNVKINVNAIMEQHVTMNKVVYVARDGEDLDVAIRVRKVPMASNAKRLADAKMAACVTMLKDVYVNPDGEGRIVSVNAVLVSTVITVMAPVRIVKMAAIVIT